MGGVNKQSSECLLPTQPTNQPASQQPGLAGDWVDGVISSLKELLPPLGGESPNALMADREERLKMETERASPME